MTFGILKGTWDATGRTRRVRRDDAHHGGPVGPEAFVREIEVRSPSGEARWIRPAAWTAYARVRFHIIRGERPMDGEGV